MAMFSDVNGFKIRICVTRSRFYSIVLHEPYFNVKVELCNLELPNTFGLNFLLT